MSTENWKRWHCLACEHECTEAEIEVVCVDEGDRHHPREHEGRCPDCGASQDQMEEVTLCESCEDEYPLEDEKYCAACMTDYAESAMGDR